MLDVEYHAFPYESVKLNRKFLSLWNMGVKIYRIIQQSWFMLHHKEAFRKLIDEFVIGCFKRYGVRVVQHIP